MSRTLTDDDVEAIARRVAELMRGARPTDPDPLMDRRGAAAYLTMATRTFDRERRLNPGTLAPAGESGPMARRWRKSTLDAYKYGARAFVRTRKRRAQ